MSDREEGVRETKLKPCDFLDGAKLVPLGKHDIAATL